MADRDEEIIARIRHFYDAFNRGDFDAAAALAHPDIDFFRSGGLPPVKGAEALREWMEPDAFDAQAFEPVEVVVNGDKVLIRQTARVRGAESRIEMELESWTVCTLDDDRRLVVRIEVFQRDQEDEARRAAGLTD